MNIETSFTSFIHSLEELTHKDPDTKQGAKREKKNAGCANPDSSPSLLHAKSITVQVRTGPGIHELMTFVFPHAFEKGRRNRNVNQGK